MYITFYFELIIKSQEVGKKRTRKSHPPFTQPPLILASYTTLAQFQNQAFGIGTFQRLYLDSPVTHAVVCACPMSVCSSTQLYYRVVFITTPTTKTLNCSFTTGLSCVTSFSHTYPLPHFLTLGNYESILHL